MQGQKGKCKDKKENARTTHKAIPWIAASKSSDQKCLEIFDENSADKIQLINYKWCKSALPHAN